MADLSHSLHILCRSNELKEKSSGLRFFVKIEHEIRSAFAIRYSGKACAYLNECAHQAVELDLLKSRFFDKSGKFLICAAHDAMYDPEAGECISGRCDGCGLAPLSVIEVKKNICFVTKAGIEFVSVDIEAEESLSNNQE